MSGARRSNRRGKYRRPAGSLRRPRPHREPRPRVLIVCEGEKTEPLYFNAFRQDRRLSTMEVTVIPGTKAGGTLPKQLVESAKKRRDQEKAARNPYDVVWCVFDCDEHQRLQEALVQARDNKIKVAFSNPSFELWYLLHFQHQGAVIDRKAVIAALRQYIPDYDKALDGMYARLKDKQQDAISRSQDLRNAQHHITAEQCTEVSPNPSTWVDKLVECLNNIPQE